MSKFTNIYYNPLPKKLENLYLKITNNIIPSNIRPLSLMDVFDLLMSNDIIPSIYFDYSLKKWCCQLNKVTDQVKFLCEINTGSYETALVHGYEAGLLILQNT